MFRNLGSLFEKKKRIISSSANTDIKIIGIVNLFLKDQFNHSSQNKLFNIRYNQKEGILRIEAGNKILANELSLRLAELSYQFQKKEIRLNRILIR